jgi:hypothetical protein
LKTLSNVRDSLLLGCFLLTLACSAPPAPSEAQKAESLTKELWRAGASFYDERSYILFKQELKAGKDHLARENSKFGWFRNYRAVQDEFKYLLKRGEDLLLKIQELKSSKSKFYADQADALAAHVVHLKQMTNYFNENGAVRKSLAQAEIKLAVLEKLIRNERYEPVGECLSGAQDYIRQAEQSMAGVLSRYMDRKELGRWRKWADETISESRTEGTVAVIVNKLERKLTIYKKGVIVASFDIALGRYGLSDKLYSGDEATPEGKYQITKKIPGGSFYKALLINYPNEEDEQAFALAKKKGLVPAHAGIGSFIEIHGGGKDNLTKGCVGLEDRDMDIVYKWAEVGTPLTIVGAVSIENTILSEVKKFDKNG